MAQIGQGYGGGVDGEVAPFVGVVVDAGLEVFGGGGEEDEVEGSAGSGASYEGGAEGVDQEVGRVVEVSIGTEVMLDGDWGEGEEGYDYEPDERQSQSQNL